MRASILSSIAMLAIVATGLSFLMLPPAKVSALITTTTITGWLIPDGTHFNNGIGALMFPLVGVGLLAGMGKVLDLEGDFGVTLVLAGLTVGGLLAMLSLNASSNNVLPFALVIIPGIDLMIWMWKGGG